MPFLVKLTRWFVSVKVFINQLLINKCSSGQTRCQTKRFDHQLVKFRGISYWHYWPMKRKGWFNRKSFALFSVLYLRWLWGLMAADQTVVNVPVFFFVVLFLWISYEFLLVCAYRALVIVSVMGCFYSHNDFTQGLRFHMNVYLFKAQMSHEFCRCLNQMDHWPPSQHHLTWFISFSTGQYLWQGWPLLSSPKTQKVNECPHFQAAQERARSSDWF